jgi:leucyl aminopeptidase
MELGAKALSQKTAAVVAPGILKDARKEAGVLAEGLLLADYRFDKYKSPDKNAVRVESLALVVKARDAAESKTRM